MSTGGAWRRVEFGLDRTFGNAGNPLRQLGGLGFFLFWVIAVSGGWLYVFYETSVEGAWRSVQWLTVDQWWGGGLMRSLHRYGSDAFVVVVVLHLVRELALGRYMGFRWYSWISGVPTLWLVVGSGAIGYWLVWDELGLFVATATAEWFGVLPGFGPALVRNFIAAEAVSDRLFSLVAFLHIGLPLALLLVMWAHVQRITRPRTGVTRALALWTLIGLIALSAAKPAVSLPPADPAMLPALIAVDWFYLAPLVASDRLSAEAVWSVSIGLTLLLVLAPWLSRTPRPAPAVVDPAHCNGCTRCFADCPYAAIAMAPHPQGRGEIAVVDADRCAACGICAGACPSASPFRRSERLTSGIDLPWLTVDMLRDRLDAAMSTAARAAAPAAAVTGRVAATGAPGLPLLVVFACERAARVAESTPRAGPPDTRLAVLELPCAGMVPPSFVDYALRHGADGVVVESCPGLDCEYRFGEQWIAQRLSGEREPRLRAAADATRLRQVEAARVDPERLAGAIEAFAQELKHRADAPRRARPEETENA
ncbi:hydrogenase iron-sulfur subunit [Zeimonas arvi]|uniref:Hydrogenase iron-sulfur subunit n=1 Tax=Zeimonas arvi TaxID=2498847 RepID=A0A5C8NQI6_9BURK|nr:hydrogenase iron-sulfur subunit [Zeimonas arvi]TXL62653.1 hydrogenase iron-sulfur subunit [Zeimonas arvi]